MAHTVEQHLNMLTDIGVPSKMLAELEPGIRQGVAAANVQEMGLNHQKFEVAGTGEGPAGIAHGGVTPPEMGGRTR